MPKMIDFLRSARTDVTALLLVCGAIGGFIASLLHIPMPWLTGSLALSAVVVRYSRHKLPQNFQFPNKIREIFIAVIGIMIGVQVHPAFLQDLPLIALSLTLMTLYVPVAHTINYLIYRRAGGYSPATAYFAAAPGGLMESLVIGEKHGADPILLALQQFLRVILVITVVPVAISLWIGSPVGSAAGLAQQLPTMSLPLWQMLPLLVITGVVGAMVGQRIKLPAGHLTGPLIAAALVNISGLVSLSLPVWLVVAAQIVIGVSLGMRFLNMGAALIMRGIGLSALSVSAMLGLGMLCALSLGWVTGQPLDLLLICFSPGGVTEMSLIALSLAANPAYVTLHHIYRIFLTVILMGFGAKYLTQDSSSS